MKHGVVRAIGGDSAFHETHPGRQRVLGALDGPASHCGSVLQFFHATALRVTRFFPEQLKLDGTAAALRPVCYAAATAVTGTTARTARPRSENSSTTRCGPCLLYTS